MSLEQAITENTAALKQLISALSGLGKLDVVTVGDTTAKTATEKPATKPAAAAKPAATTKPAAAVEETKQAVAETAAPEVTYDQLKVKVLELAAKDRDQVMEVLSRFGVTTAKDLQPEQFADALADFERVLAGGLA